MRNERIEDVDVEAQARRESDRGHALDGARDAIPVAETSERERVIGVNGQPAGDVVVRRQLHARSDAMSRPHNDAVM